MPAALDVELREGLGERGLHGGGFLAAEVAFLAGASWARLTAASAAASSMASSSMRHVGEHVHARLSDLDEAFADGEVVRF